MTDLLPPPARRLKSWLVGDEYRYLITALVFVWGILDTITTYFFILVHGTTRYELNPIVRAVFEIDIRLFIALKLSVTGFIVATAFKKRPTIETARLWRPFFYIYLCVGIAVVVNNVVVGLRGL